MRKAIRLIVPNSLSLEVHRDDVATHKEMQLGISILVPAATDQTANKANPFILILLTLVAVKILGTSLDDMAGGTGVGVRTDLFIGGDPFGQS